MVTWTTWTTLGTISCDKENGGQQPTIADNPANVGATNVVQRPTIAVNGGRTMATVGICGSFKSAMTLETDAGH